MYYVEFVVTSANLMIFLCVICSLVLVLKPNRLYLTSGLIGYGCGSGDA